MQYGTSPTEIILAIAVVIVANAFMIGLIAILLKVLIPRNPTHNKTKNK
jgi:hypothetical protein